MPPTVKQVPLRQAPLSSLLKFFLLTYAVTWPCFILVIVLSRNAATTVPAVAGLRWLLLYIGIFAPSFVALGLTAREDGRTGVLALLGRLFEWQVGARWYVFAAGYMAAIKLAVALVQRIATSAWPRFGDLPWYVLAGATIMSTPFQAGEEIGWRGYALPRLAARFGLGPGSVLLGVIWACWHLPLFFYPAADTYGQSFVVYLLGVTALSVSIGWLFGNTNGSLLLVMLLHAAINNTKDMVPSASPGATNAFSLAASPVAWLTVALLWVFAAFFLRYMPKPAFPPSNAD